MIPVTNSANQLISPPRTNSLQPARLLWGVWLISFILGAVGAYMRFTRGHLPAGYGSYVPWGLWVAFYFHGVGIAGGVFLLGAGGYVFSIEGFREKCHLRNVIVLSAAAILPAFLGIWFDLGHMERMYFIFASPSFTSMMAFNAWMYMGFLVIAALCWMLSFLHQTEWLKPLLCLGIFLSILFPSQSGAFFGVVDVKPYWHSALLPILFLASCVITGAAALLLMRWFFLGESPSDNRSLSILRMVALVGLCSYFVLEFAELSLFLWNPQSPAPAIELLLWGPYWWMFWLIHIVIGGVLVFILLARSHRLAWVCGSLIIVITFVSGRLNILLPGQSVGEIKGLQEAFQHPRLNYIYHPTVMEYFVVLLMFAIAMAVMYAGVKLSRFLAAGADKS